MQREHIKALLPVFQAFTEGKTIQIKNYQGEFVDCDDDIMFCQDPGNYRVKPEPTFRWRPWKPEEIPGFFVVQSLAPRFGEPQFAVAIRQITADIVIGDSRWKSDDVHRLYRRVLEDGMTLPCGVLEKVPS